MKFYPKKMRRKHYYNSYALEQFIRAVEDFYTFVYFSTIQQSPMYEIHRGILRRLLENLRDEQHIQKEN